MRSEARREMTAPMGSWDAGRSWSDGRAGAGLEGFPGARDGICRGLRAEFPAGAPAARFSGGFGRAVLVVFPAKGDLGGTSVGPDWVVFFAGNDPGSRGFAIPH